MAFHIAIVDRSRDFPSLLQSAAKSLRAEFSILPDAPEAAQLLENQKVDAVIVRLAAGRADEIEVIKRVRASPLNGKIPIVMITELEELDAIRAGFLGGATVFLSPPLTVERVNGLLNFLRGPMYRERRRIARLPFCTQVDCTFGPFGENHFKANSLNIGLGGMLLEPSGGLRVGDELTLDFRIPRVAKPLRVRARIARKDSPDRIGVEFLELRARDREAIDFYVTGLYKE